MCHGFHMRSAKFDKCRDAKRRVIRRDAFSGYLERILLVSPTNDVAQSRFNFAPVPKVDPDRRGWFIHPSGRFVPVFYRKVLTALRIVEIAQNRMSTRAGETDKLADSSGNAFPSRFLFVSLIADPLFDFHDVQQNTTRLRPKTRARGR